MNVGIWLPLGRAPLYGLINSSGNLGGVFCLFMQLVDFHLNSCFAFIDRSFIDTFWNVRLVREIIEIRFVVEADSNAIPTKFDENIYNLTKIYKKLWKDYARPILRLIFSSSLLTFTHKKKSQKCLRSIFKNIARIKNITNITKQYTKKNNKNNKI